MDSKPSGQSKQLIQYSSQSWEQLATHQRKYGGPGIFPVVHLSKKNIPIRSITPNEISMHMNIQESSYYHHKENSNAVEDLTHYGNHERCCNNQEANINAHNLLDALKEVSRKRIHSENEDLHTHTSSKQQKCADTNSSTNVTNTSIQVADVPPVINPVTASLSSARSYIDYIRKEFKKKKRAETTPTTEHKHALTQTDNPVDKSEEPPSDTLDNSLRLKNPVRIDDNSKESTSFSAMISKLFDETQFEATKKNKLALLLSPLTGSKAKLLLYELEPLKTNTDENVLTPSEIKHASILSPKNKPKHGKHVTFAIPEKEDTEDTSVNISKNVSVIDAYSGITDGNDDKHLQSTENLGASNSKQKESDEHLTSESTPRTESSPSSIESNIPLVANVPATLTSTIVSMPSSNTSAPVKIGGFKFDFKDHCTFQSQESGSLLHSANDMILKTHTNFNDTNSNPPTVSSSIASMLIFSSNSPTHSSEIVNTFFKSESNLKPKSCINTNLDLKENISACNSVTNAKINPSYSNFGANTTVTSVGRSMLLSTGLGTSNVVATTALPISSHAASFSNLSSLNSPKLNFDADQTQPFGAKFGINTISSSVSSGNSNCPSVGYDSSNLFNTTSKHTLNFTTNPTPGHAVAATNFSTASTNNNAGTTIISPTFGSVQNLSLNKGESNEAVTGFTFGKPLDSQVLSSSQFKQNPNGSTSGFGDNKITLTESPVTSNQFNTGISSKNCVFGATTSNSVADFASTPLSINSMFTSSSNVPSAQSETFTFGTSNPLPPNIDTFGVQGDISNNGKFNLLNTTNASPLLNTAPNSVFGSVAPSALQSSTNSFCFPTSAGFNNLTYNNAVSSPHFDSATSKIFSIGSGTSYPKPRTHLRGRRRT